jgi:hypothetical protein
MDASSAVNEYLYGKASDKNLSRGRGGLAPAPDAPETKDLFAAPQPRCAMMRRLTRANNGPRVAPLWELSGSSFV